MKKTIFFAFGLFAPLAIAATPEPPDKPLSGECATTGVATVESLPRVPDAVVGAMVDSSLVLSIEYDECGNVLDATVENGSGSRQVDAAAIALAKTWHVGPDRSIGAGSEGRLKMPLRFSKTLSVPEKNGAASPPPPPPPPLLSPPPDLQPSIAKPAAPLPDLPAPYRYFNGNVSSLRRDAPKFPPIEGLFGIGGAVITIIDVDAGGLVSNVSIERSSRNRSLDRAAMDTAKVWRFVPNVTGGRTTASRVRIPVDFDPYERWTDGLRDPKPERSRVPEVAPLPDGSLPGYVPDPLALGVASVADAVSMLGKNAVPKPTATPGSATFLLEDANGISKWSICVSGCPAVPSLRRWRLVNDGKQAFWASSFLCESTDQAACASLKSWIEKGSPPQPAGRQP